MTMALSTTTAKMASALLPAMPAALSFLFILSASQRVGAGIWNLRRMALIYDAQKPVKSSEADDNDSEPTEPKKKEASDLASFLAVFGIFIAFIVYVYFYTTGNASPHSWEPLNVLRRSLPYLIAAFVVYFAACATYKLYARPLSKVASRALCRTISDKAGSSLIGHLRVVRTIDYQDEEEEEERMRALPPSIRGTCVAIAALVSLSLAMLPRGALADYSFFLLGAWACFTTCYETVGGFSMALGSFSKRPFRAFVFLVAMLVAFSALLVTVLVVLLRGDGGGGGDGKDTGDDDVTGDYNMAHIFSIMIAGHYAQSTVVLTTLLAIGARFDATVAAIKRGSKTMGITRTIADGILAESRLRCHGVKDAETGKMRTPILIAAYNDAPKGMPLALNDMPVLRAGLIVCLVASLAGISLNQHSGAIVIASDGRPLPLWNVASHMAIPFAIVAMLWAARGAPISLWNYTEDWQPQDAIELDEEAAEVANLLGGQGVEDEKDWLRADWDGEK